MVKEINATTGNITDYLYGDDLIKQSKAANDSYYLYDGLGSTKALSDGIGLISDTYDYSSFGKVLNKTGSTENNYLFTGEQFDSSLDNYYLRARYYDQSIGRFTQQDTWMGKRKQPITFNKYLYANANPIYYTDSSGNSSLSIGGQMAAIGTLGYLISTASPSYNSGSVGFITRRVSIDEPARLLVYLATIGYANAAGIFLNQEHPSKADEKEALDEITGAEDCGTIAWAIDILERGIKWRKEDLKRHPEDTHNAIGKGHRDRIKRMQKKLDRLRKIYADKGC